MDAKPTPDEALDERTAATLAAALRPIEPPPERRQALRAALLEKAGGGHDLPGLITIRKQAEGWLEPLPGVRIKLLNAEADGGAESYLIRLEPGARAPAHDHPGIEECVVLEGSVRYVGGAVLKAGDYQLAQLGAHHTELVSDSGALVFIRDARPLSNYLPL